MKKDQEPKTKDVYRLWREYLKRSEKYKVFCEIKRDPDRHDFNEIKALYEKRANFVPKKGIKKTKEEQLGDEIWSLSWDLTTFGDVFCDSFEEWWEEYKPKLRKNVIDFAEPLAYEASPYFLRWSFMYDDHFKRGKKNIGQFITEELDTDPNYVVVAVPTLGDITMKEISHQISKIRENGKMRKNPELHDNFIRYKIPIGRVRYDELKRYLQVYDLKQQKMSIKEIIKKIWPGKNDRDDHVRRQVYSDIEKAEKVIENVEQGYFPSKRVPSDK